MQNRIHDSILAIRQWPEHHRKIFAASMSAFITLIIAGGWAATLPGQFAALSAPPSSEVAAASLSVVTSPAPAQSPSATELLQKNLNQGGQILDSFKDSFSSFFSGSGSAASDAGSNAAASSAPQQSAVVTITTPGQAPNNAYSNLKYYVSHGVLITDPPAKKSQ